MQVDQVSERRLARVTPKVARVIRAAIEAAPFHIRCTSGLRTIQEQRVLFEAGKTRTMSSRHFGMPPDGLSHAADLVAIIDGEGEWSMEWFYKIANLVREAAIAQDVPIVWGAIWDTPLPKVEGDLPIAVTRYRMKFQQKFGRKPFLDAPHFQLGL